MGKVLGRKVKYQNIPEAMMMKALISQGFPASMVGQLAIYTEEYRRGTFAVNAPNNVVRDLTGRRQKISRQWPEESWRRARKRYGRLATS